MGQFDETVDPEQGVDLTPAPGLDPLAAAATPFIVPPALLNGPQMARPMPPQVQMPTPPQAPAAPGTLQHIISAAIAGLAAGLGSRHAGGGIASGLLEGQQINETQRQQTFKDQQTQFRQQQEEALKQQHDMANQQILQQRADEDRMAKRRKMLGDVASTVPTLETKEDYDKFMDRAGMTMVMAGYRDLNPTVLRQNFPFQPPDLAAKVSIALNKYNANPLVREKNKADPTAAFRDLIRPAGKDEQGNPYPSMTIADAMKLTGIELTLDDENSIPAGKLTEFQGAEQSAKQEFINAHGVPPKKEDSPAIYKRAREMMQNKDEALTALTRELAAQRLEHLKTPPIDKLVKVEHKDPTTGRTVIEWLPESQLRGQTFEKGATGATETRLASAQAVNQTGADIIAKLSDPAYAKSLGVVMGRFSKLKDFIGNPPPEFSELAGTIESYALANMGVHGMRSAQGAEQIKKLLEQPHTPASLIAAIKGLSKFSEHFMQNEGRGSTAPAAPDPAASARQKLEGR